uniref:NADH-ubiquinone oxidoreductase chain 5 n=1 Tax=Anadara pilula TaxID=935003 RepID=A0A1U9ALS1_9BIVA|nr:NADH dehydrogenase subunit 5 [Anadara pilula]
MSWYLSEVGMTSLMWVTVMVVVSLSSVLGLWVVGWGSMCLEMKVLSSSPEMFDIVLLLDSVSLSFVSLVLFISSSVMVYSLSYMESSESSSRLSSLVVVFVLSMIMLILFPSMLGVIIGWDGLGLSSFLLVVFYQNDTSLSSGVLTALSNRVGDGLLIVGMGVCMIAGNWSSYFELCGLVSAVIGLSSMTKSAQVPFCAWLPAAMAAPTPVSSLVHSSTLVTAGVYLLLRYNMVKDVADVLLVVGSLTSILGGISAVYEVDVKKVVALSTLSQLGMMVFVVSVGFKTLCLLHLYMHALLKASLFLSVGALIYARGEQSIFSLKGSVVESPGSSGVVLVACAALSGLPFLCGWFSKDFILEASLSGVGWVYSLTLLVGSVSSVVYSGRLVWTCLFGPVGFSSVSRSADCEVMLMSMSVLMFSLLLGGPFFSYWLSVGLVPISTGYEKASGLIALGVGVIFVNFWFRKVNQFDFKKWSEWDKGHFKAVSVWSDFWKMMWFLPVLSGEVGMGGLVFSNLSFRWFEQGWFETLGGKGLQDLWSVVFSVHSRSQSGGFNMSMNLMIISFFILIVGVGLWV